VLLESESFFNYVTKTAKGTKMPRGDKSAILEFEFNLPSLKIQKEISHQIISIEKKIRLNEQINDNLAA
ncbi:restriction endonuclease subunit S, partial [Lactobacillus delbrueckii]